jgi:ribulose-5-phosphate 4-epimerase/fuculose-1-phosphate aldolase
MMTDMLLSDENLKAEYRKFAKWARKAGKLGLVKCSSGNLSQRLINGNLMVSESRSWLGELKCNQISLVDPLDGSIIKGNKPTGELPLHLEIMKRNKSVNTILHCQSEAATALACMGADIDYNVIIEVPLYLGNVTHIPFIMPGSVELATAVADASATSGVIQMQNHGQVIIGSGYREVIEKAVFFELACKIILQLNFQHKVLALENIGQLTGYR